MRLLAACTVLLALAACGSDAEPSDTTTSPAGLANPASVFCVDQGGAVEIVDEADGEVGYCILPDGTQIEEWEYFRSQSPTATSTP